MATLRDLKPSFLALSETERFALIKLRRESRRTVKVMPKKARAKAAAKPKRSVSPLNAAKSLTPAQKAVLLKELME